MASVEERRKEFGAAVRKAREAKGWSQTRLAESLVTYLIGLQLEPVGTEITQGAVTQWERGETTPRRERVHPLEQVLGLEPGALGDILDDVQVKRVRADRPAAHSGITVPDDFTVEERAQIQGYIDGMAANRGGRESQQ